MRPQLSRNRRQGVRGRQRWRASKGADATRDAGRRAVLAGYVINSARNKKAIVRTIFGINVSSTPMPPSA